MADEVRMEKLLAKALIIDGRKELYCRYCSDTNVSHGREKVRCHAGRKQRAQGERASDGGSFQEIVKMEVEEEVDIKNELDQRKKELQKQLRRQQELQDVEQRRNDL